MGLKTAEQLRECVHCQRSYTPTYKPQRFCSRQCSMKVVGLTMKTSIVVGCGRCGKQFERRLSALSKHKNNNFCSWKCRKVPTSKVCEGCKQPYPTTSAHWKTSRFCSKSCAKSGSNHHFFGKQSPMKGVPTWITGLTKQTDSRVALMAEKVSRTHKLQFATGIRSNKGESNPNFGKTVEQRTPEQLDNYSRGAATRILNGVCFSTKNYKSGYYQSTKTGQVFHYRSSYELRTMKCFDKDNQVLNYQAEPFAIVYSSYKRYIPDFLVVYNSGSKEIIECKGEHILNQAATKLEAGMSYARNNHLTFKVLTLKEIKSYEKKLGII